MSDSYGTQRWVSFYNDSGLVIPSYALIMLVSDKGTTSSTKNFCKRLRARQYTSGGTGQFSDQGIYAFNSRSPVEPETYGKCNFAVDGPAWARIKDVDVDGTDLNADTDWLGKEYGPINEKWSIGPDGGGYVLLTRPKQLDGASYHRVLVMKKADTLTLLKSTETVDILGPRSSFIGGATPPSAKHTGLACIVDIATGDYDDSVEFDVDTSYIGSALVMPNADGTYPLNAQYLMWARKHGDKFYAVSGGTPAFEGEITTSEGGDQYTVTPIIPSTATPIICESLFSESYVIGQRCWVQMQGSSPFITHSGCVP